MTKRQLLRLGFGQAVLIATALIIAPLFATNSVDAERATAAPAIATARARSAEDCAKLKGLSLENTRIEIAEAITGGAFTPPVTPADPTPQTLTDLPSFCRVAGTIDHNIRFEVWLPLRNWNGIYHGVGIGGFAGSITYSSARQESLPGLAESLRRGDAASATDDGHEASGLDGTFAIGHLKLLKDMLLDGTHKTAVASKAIVSAFYDRKPMISSFAGCSGGGHEALTEATRFPDDYDAIVAFAPAAMELSTGGVLTRSIAAHRNPATIFTAAQVALTWNAAMKQCDGNDGLVDGSIEDPRRCNFKPEELLCKPGQTENCLSEGQVKALDVQYQPLRNSKGGTLFDAPGADFYPASPPGNGAGSLEYSGREPFFISFAKAFEQNANWDWHTFNIRETEEWIRKYAKWGETADFTQFRNRGGKIILMQGWADWGVVPGQTIGYYKKALRTTLGRRITDSTSADASHFMRLFMAPDTSHCGGGSGANQFDVLTAVEAWRETGTAPKFVIASRMSVASGVVDRTRPICPYPEEAIYKGTGDINEAGNFKCGIRKASRVK